MSIPRYLRPLPLLLRTSDEKYDAQARRFVAAPLVAASLGFGLATDAAIEPNE